MSVDDSAEDLARLAWALAHPARVRILRLLIARDSCVCGEIVDQMPLAQSTVSQHLKILKQSGLVQGEVDGPKVCYCVDRSRLNELAALVADLQADR
jgi:ArsR family transcriptional regulator